MNMRAVFTVSLFCLIALSSVGAKAEPELKLHLRSDNYSKCSDIDIEVRGNVPGLSAPMEIGLRSKVFSFSQYVRGEDTFQLWYSSPSGDSLALVAEATLLYYQSCYYDYQRAIPVR